jgi:hypothetical protein
LVEVCEEGGVGVALAEGGREARGEGAEEEGGAFGADGVVDV